MIKIQIEKIKIKDNIRKDYGDLTELAASIRVHGVRNPIELNKNFELIDGFRRVIAAKSAGLKEIPYFLNEEEMNKVEAQIISGIFQKNLNPVEEGIALRKYMDANKLNSENVSKAINKTKSYIEKRLLLVDLPEDVKEALIKKKIQIGHALLLAKFTKTDSSKFLREIKREDYSVESAKENLEYSGLSLELARANFDKSQCKGCKHNGSEQSELFETGKILNGTCMNSGCFSKKLKEFIKKAKEEFKDVLYVTESDYSKPVGYIDSSNTWQLEDNKITKDYIKKCRKEKYNYLVKVKDDGEIIEYFKIPPKKVGNKVVESKDETRKLKLTEKVNDFKRTFLINKSIEFMKPGTKQTKALSLIRLIQGSTGSEIDVVNLGNFVNKGYGGEANVKNIFLAKEEELDKAIELLSRNAFRRVHLKDLIETSKNFKVDIKKHFAITKEYLELYTKDQLVKLIEEFKLNDSEKDLKKGDLIQHILNQNLKGKVPKILF